MLFWGAGWVLVGDGLINGIFASRVCVCVYVVTRVAFPLLGDISVSCRLRWFFFHSG